MSYLSQAKQDEDLSGFSDWEIAKSIHAQYIEESGDTESDFEEFSAEIGLKPRITDLDIPVRDEPAPEQPIAAEQPQPVIEQPTIMQPVQQPEPIQTDVPQYFVDQPVTEQPQPDIVPDIEGEPEGDDGDAGSIATLAAGGAQATLGMGESVFRTPQTVNRVIGAISELGEKLGAPAWMNKKLAFNPIDVIEHGFTIGDFRIAGTTDVADKIRASMQMLPQMFPSFENLAIKSQEADAAFQEAIKGNFEKIGGVVTDPEAWAGFIGQAIPSLFAAWKSGGSMAFVSWLEGMEAAGTAEEYERVTGQEMSDTDFTNAVLVVGLANGLLEKLGIDKIIAGTGSPIKRFFLGGAWEGGTEGMQAFTGNLAQRIYDPEAELTEGILSGIMGGTAAGGGLALAKGKRETAIDPGQEPDIQRIDDPGMPQAGQPIEPTEDEIQDKRQSETAADLQEFMSDERPSADIIAEREATEKAEQEAAAQEQERQAITAEQSAQFQQEHDLAAAQRKEQEDIKLDAAFARAEQDAKATQDELVDFQVQQDKIEAEQPTAMQLAMEKAMGTDTDAGTQESPIEVETAEDVEQATIHVEQNPTDAQKEAGNYKHAHIKMYGLDISIENEKGGTRSGKDSDGEEWSVTMPAHYGYIKRTEGADGDHVDVYIGDNPESTAIFVVDQIDPETGSFDEHKVIFGTDNQAQAETLYDGGFSDGSGRSRMGAVTAMSVAQFRQWIKNGDTKQAFRYEKPKPKKLTARPKKARKGPTRTIDPKKDDILSAIAKLGGLNRKESGAQGIDSAEFGRRGHRIFRVFTKDGRLFDEIALALHEQGYPVADEKGNYDPNILLESISDALAGKKVLTTQGLEETQVEEDPYEALHSDDLDDLSDILENATDGAKDLAARLHEATVKLGENDVESIRERVSIQSEAQTAEEYENAILVALQTAIDRKQQDQDDAELKGRDQVIAPTQKPVVQKAQPEFKLEQQQVTPTAPQLPSITQDDMFGGRSETAQAIKDREVAQKAKEQRAPDVGMGEGALFTSKTKQIDIEDVKPPVIEPKTEPEEAGVKDLNGNIIKQDLMIEVTIDIIDSDEKGTATFNAAETMSELRAKQDSYKALQDCLR